VQAVRLGGFDIANVSGHIRGFSNQIAKSIAKISSGDRFVAGGASATLSFSERLKSAINENVTMMKSIRDSIGSYEVARSEALMKVDVTSRIKELAVAYNNDTLTDSEKGQIQDQVDELSKLLYDEKKMDYLRSTIKITTLDNFENMKAQADSSLNVISTHAVGESSFVFFQDNEIQSKEISLKSILDDNNSFINSSSIDVSSSQQYVYTSEGIERKNDNYHYFDLSSEGAQASIDSAFNGYVSSAASITSSMNIAEIRLDEIQNKQTILQEALNNAPATDLAEETANLIKAQLGREMGVNLLKAQNDLEKNMVLALLVG